MRERYRIADLTLDVEASSLTRETGEEVALPRLSFDLLAALARRAPAVVPAEELLATVWNGAAVAEETLAQRAALLRRALGDDDARPRYLRAVRGRGYQLVPRVVRLAYQEEPPRARRAMAAAIVLALAALGAGLYFLLLAYGRAQTAPAAAGEVSTGTASVPELLARAGSYLRRHQESDHELAAGLYRRALQLEPDNPQALAGLSLALAQRATQLNRGGERAQAMELAKQALAIDPRLGLAHHAMGLALDSQGRVTPAIAAYLRAAELEPDPTAALAGAAYLLQVQGHLADALEADVRIARDVRDAADSPEHLEAQTGQTLALLGFDAAAEAWLRRALELRPDNAFAPGAFARLRLSQGRLREADDLAARALRRGIRRPELATLRGTVALLEGDEPRAKAFFTDAVAIDAEDLRARTRLLLLDRRRPGGETDAALEARYRDAVLRLRQARTAGDERPEGAIDEMLLAAGFGDDDAAFEALDAAIALGYRDAGWLRLDPMLAGLRRRPQLALRIAAIRRLIDAERRKVVGAAWLPGGFLKGEAG